MVEDNMMIDVEKNNVLISNENKFPFLKATLNFEKVYDSSDPKGRDNVGIVPIFTIYSIGAPAIDEEAKALYKKYYLEMLSTISLLIPDVKYMNSFDGDGKIYTLVDSMIQGKDEHTYIPKIPEETVLKLV